MVCFTCHRDHDKTSARESRFFLDILVHVKRQKKKGVKMSSVYWIFHWEMPNLAVVMLYRGLAFLYLQKKKLGIRLARGYMVSFDRLPKIGN